MSLNSRISTREKCDARRAVVDCEMEPHRRSNAHTEVTTILETVKPQNDYRNELVAEDKIEERVNGESYDHHGVLHSHASSSSHEYYTPREVA